MRPERDRFQNDERRSGRPEPAATTRPHRRGLGPRSYGRPEATTHEPATDRLRRSCPRAFDGNGDNTDWREAWNRTREKRRVRGWLQRQRRRAATSRLRKPLVGIAMAGAAAPLVRPATESGEIASEAATEAERLAAATATGETAAESAERLQQQEQARIRDELLQGAVNRYNIDWELAADIHDIAVEEGIEPKIAFGLVKTESTFKHGAVSPVGARGLTQLLPSTARWMMPEIKSNQLHDQETNLRVGFRYLRYLTDKYKGNMELALLAYNRGPGTVDRVLSRGGNPDNGYARKVIQG